MTRFFNRPFAGSPAPRARHARPLLEELECRAVPASISLSDPNGVVWVEGRTGDDTVTVSVQSNGYTSVTGQGLGTVLYAPGLVKKVVFHGNGGNDNFFNFTAIASEAHGGSGADWFYGGSGNDTFNGYGGADVLDGNGGHDALSGGSGNDSLYGGSGHDVLDGGLGADKMYGEEGNDTLISSGDSSFDSCYGGTGVDFFIGLDFGLDYRPGEDYWIF